MYPRLDSWQSAWSVFEGVQPLFELELPWQADVADGANEIRPSEAAGVQTFVACFIADVKHAPRLLPQHGLSDNESSALLETLSDLLRFLESVVRNDVFKSNFLPDEAEREVHMSGSL